MILDVLMVAGLFAFAIAIYAIVIRSQWQFSRRKPMTKAEIEAEVKRLSATLKDVPHGRAKPPRKKGASR